MFVYSMDATCVTACDGAEADELSANCAATGGRFEDVLGMQCTCTHQRTVFPMGVEHLKVQFSHAYETTALAGSLAGGVVAIRQADGRPTEHGVEQVGWIVTRRGCRGLSCGLVLVRRRAGCWRRADQLWLLHVHRGGIRTRQLGRRARRRVWRWKLRGAG